MTNTDEPDEEQPHTFRLCAHADQYGAGIHWLRDDQRCPLLIQQQKDRA